jgi:hypothetical protein
MGHTLSNSAKKLFFENGLAVKKSISKHTKNLHQIKEISCQKCN